MGRGRSKIVPLTARKSYLIVSLVNRDKTKGKRKTKGEKMKERKNSKEVELKLRQYNRTIIFILCLWIVHGKRTSKRRNEKERMYEINLVDKKKRNVEIKKSRPYLLVDRIGFVRSNSRLKFENESIELLVRSI